MLPTPPRIVVIGSPETGRCERANRLARHYHVPRLSIDEVLCTRTGATPTPLGGHGVQHNGTVLQAIVARLGPAAGHVIDCTRRDLRELASTGGSPASLGIPTDLIVHLRSAGSDADAHTGYYEARGVLFGFDPSVADDEIRVTVEACVRSRPGLPPRLPVIPRSWSLTDPGHDDGREHGWGPAPQREARRGTPSWGRP